MHWQPSERKLMHADVQQRLHCLRLALLFARNPIRLGTVHCHGGAECHAYYALSELHPD
jgi:hypothetical protein